MGDPWSSGAGTAGDPGEGMRCFGKGLSIVGAGIWAEIQGLTRTEGEVRERHLSEGGLAALLRQKVKCLMKDFPGAPANWKMLGTT